MALALLDAPEAYDSFQDDLVYTVIEATKVADPTTYPNYKYIADIYIAGDLVARIKKYPDPITGIGYFNIGQIVRNYNNTVFNPDANALIAQTLSQGEFYLNVQIKFGEEYAFTSYYNLTVDAIRPFFNNYNIRELSSTSSMNGVVNNLATNRQRDQIKILLTSQFHFLPFFAYSGGTPALTITPDVGGTPYSGNIAPTAKDMIELNMSPAGVNALQPGLITANTNYYVISVNGQFVRYTIICESLHEVHTLHFLNKYGAFESHLFTKVSRRSVNLEKKDFGKLPFTIGNDGSVNRSNSNKVFNESRSVYSSQFKEQLVLNSDWLTDMDYAWLQELILSPMVYIEESGYFLPVVVTARDYEQKKYINEGQMSNLTITVEYGNQLNAQYR